MLREDAIPMCSGIRKKSGIPGIRLEFLRVPLPTIWKLTNAYPSHAVRAITAMAVPACVRKCLLSLFSDRVNQRPDLR